MNSNGSTINKRRAKSKNDIFFAKSIQDAQVSVGLMDFKFSSIEMAIISGDSSLDKQKLIKDSFDKKIEQKANTDVSSKSNRNSSESEPSGALQELNSTEIIENIIIVNSTYTSSRASIKVLNLADYEIFDLILEISTTNGNTILFPIKKLKPRSEKTFYGIKLNELDIKDGQKISFKIIKANKFIKN